MNEDRDVMVCHYICKHKVNVWIVNVKGMGWHARGWIDRELAPGDEFLAMVGDLGPGLLGECEVAAKDCGGRFLIRLLKKVENHSSPFYPVILFSASRKCNYFLS